jgi:hypothetical protein
VSPSVIAAGLRTRRNFISFTLLLALLDVAARV